MKVRSIIAMLIVILINVMAWVAIMRNPMFDMSEVIKLSITDLLLIIAVAPPESLQEEES